MDKIIDFCQEHETTMKMKYIPGTNFIHFKFYEDSNRNHILSHHISGTLWASAFSGTREAMLKEILDKLQETYSTEKE